MRPSTQKNTPVTVNVTRERNDSLYDRWSLVHVVTGIALGWIMSPIVALVVMVGWEPLEILVISPLAARFDVTFGYETWRNSLSDIVFDIVGVLLGTVVLASLANPPFYLF